MHSGSPEDEFEYENYKLEYEDTNTFWHFLSLQLDLNIQHSMFWFY